MANSISHLSKGIVHNINNSWTSVLYSTLLISGSEQAKTDWEKLFMIWLAEHDQGYIGLGFVGIDFDDIQWSIEAFEEQKYFVVKIAQKAIADKSWTKLDYKTDRKILSELLQTWIDVFSNTEAGDIDENLEVFEWYNEPSSSKLDKKCKIHNIYLNQLGETDSECCYLCNDN